MLSHIQSDSGLIARAVLALLRVEPNAQPHIASCAVIIWRGLTYVAVRAMTGQTIALYRFKNRGDLSRLKRFPRGLVLDNPTLI